MLLVVTNASSETPKSWKQTVSLKLINQLIYKPHKPGIPLSQGYFFVCVKQMCVLLFKTQLFSSNKSFIIISTFAEEASVGTACGGHCTHSSNL